MWVFIEPFTFSFFSITGWGIDLDYGDIEWFALETNRDHSVIFEIASKYCILDSFAEHEAYSISSEVFLPTVVDIMVTAMARALSVAERSSPESEVWGGGREEPLHVRAQGQRSEGATPRPRPGAPAWKINPRPKSGGCTGAGGPRGAIPR